MVTACSPEIQRPRLITELLVTTLLVTTSRSALLINEEHRDLLHGSLAGRGTVTLRSCEGQGSCHRRAHRPFTRILTTLETLMRFDRIGSSGRPAEGKCKYDDRQRSDGYEDREQGVHHSPTWCNC